MDRRKGTVIQEIARLRAWIDDLQSGQWVNCVYCGHRYGPADSTPVSRAELLKEHVMTCPDHPMSALKKENLRLLNVLRAAKLMIGEIL